MLGLGVRARVSGLGFSVMVRDRFTQSFAFARVGVVNPRVGLRVRV